HIIHLYVPANAVGRQTPDGIRDGTGSRVGSTNNNLTIGAMQRTDRPLDTMLLKPNYFYQIHVQTDNVDEIRYTRAGNFYVTPTGNGDEVRLVTSDGHYVYGVNGPIEFFGNFDGMRTSSRGEVGGT